MPPCRRGCKNDFIMRLYSLYRSEKVRNRLRISLNRPYDRIADSVGMSVNAVRRRVHRLSRCPQGTRTVPPTPTTPVVFDAFTIGTIRRNVHAIFAARETFTLDSLTEDLKMSGIIPEGTSNASVWRLLHNMGFRYKTSRRKVYVRKESLNVVCRRISALRALKRHREEGRQVVYLDETLFTTRMDWIDSTQPNTSTTASSSRHLPSGEAEPFVVVAAGTANGFVENSFLCFRPRKTSGDYCGEMNGELFLRWLTSQLLPSLSGPSVLVMDNAPYHSQLTEESRCPSSSTEKADIVEWLEQRKLLFPPEATRPELLLICKRNQPEPQYVVDNVVHEWGHEVVRLPPAHPELNAIEQVWGHMTRHVRCSPQRFTRAHLLARLEEARLEATSEVWRSAVRRSQAFEEEYWATDNSRERVDPVITNLASEDEDDLFLDSEED